MSSEVDCQQEPGPWMSPVCVLATSNVILKEMGLNKCSMSMCCFLKVTDAGVLMIFQDGKRLAQKSKRRKYMQFEKNNVIGTT